MAQRNKMTRILDSKNPFYLKKGVDQMVGTFFYRVKGVRFAQESLSGMNKNVLSDCIYG